MSAMEVGQVARDSTVTGNCARLARCQALAASFHSLSLLHVILPASSEPLVGDALRSGKATTLCCALAVVASLHAATKRSSCM